MSAIEDPQTQILLHLMRSKPKKARTAKAIAHSIGRSESTVRYGLQAMTWRGQDPWVVVESDDGLHPTVWVLTDKGREVAHWRARHG